jgi:acyl-CoA reductase-like NAD-dependent aldehyde dehydrogenase
VLLGGYRVNHRGERDDKGFYVAPTVLEVPMERAGIMRCVNEENFFPLLPVIKASGGGLTPRERDKNIFAAMTNLLDNNQYGLRISIWVKDQAYLRKFIEETHQSGLLRINSRHVGFSPYLSGNGGVGRSGGPFGEMNYVWMKTSHLQGISVRQDEPSPNLTPAPAAPVKHIEEPEK